MLSIMLIVARDRPDHGSGSNRRIETELWNKNQNQTEPPVLWFQTEPELGPSQFGSVFIFLRAETTSSDSWTIFLAFWADRPGTWPAGTWPAWPAWGLARLGPGQQLKKMNRLNSLYEGTENRRF